MLMKNQIILMAAAALAFASCSKDEMTEVNPGNAISFQSAVTRSSDITTSGLQDIYVTALHTTTSGANALTAGTPYFHKVLYHKQEQENASPAWLSTPQYYWPSSGYLTFVAWAPEAVNSQIPEYTPGSALPATFTFTPEANVANQVDFIGAISSALSAPSTAAVPLTFHHELANIIINAKNTNAAYVYTVTGVRIGHVYDRGVFSLAKATTTGAWTYDGAAYTNYTIEYDQPVSLGATAQSIMDGQGQSTYKSAKLIPASYSAWTPASNSTNTGDSAGSYISVKVKITTADGAKVFPKNSDEYGWVSVPVAFRWSKSSQYTYVLDFSSGAGYVDPETDPDPDTGINPGDKVLGNAITFTVSETPWVGVTAPETPMTPATDAQN